MRKTPVTPSVKECAEHLIEIFKENAPSNCNKTFIAQSLGFANTGVFYKRGNDTFSRWKIALDSLLKHGVIEQIGNSTYRLKPDYLEREIDKDNAQEKKPLFDFEQKSETRELKFNKVNTIGVNTCLIDGKLSAVDLVVRDEKIKLSLEEFENLKYIINLIK